VLIIFICTSQKFLLQSSGRICGRGDLKEIRNMVYFFLMPKKVQIKTVPKCVMMNTEEVPPGTVLQLISVFMPMFLRNFTSSKQVSN
jgi:hypothetical protein